MNPNGPFDGADMPVKMEPDEAVGVDRELFNIFTMASNMPEDSSFGQYLMDRDWQPSSSSLQPSQLDLLDPDPMRGPASPLTGPDLLTTQPPRVSPTASSSSSSSSSSRPLGGTPSLPHLFAPQSIPSDVRLNPPSSTFSTASHMPNLGQLNLTPLSLPPVPPLPAPSLSSHGDSQMESSHHTFSSDDDDSEEEIEPPKRGKGRPRGKAAKKESSATPSSTTFTSPYYNEAHSNVDGEDEPDRSKKRSVLARKAELARASRRRKKMYIQDLEVKVKKLGMKIEELQKKQAKVKAQQRERESMPTWAKEEKERAERQQKIRQELMEIVKMSSVDDQTNKNLISLVTKFVENSRERQARVDYYLDRAEDCMTPGLQVKFALWGLDQKDDFYSKPGLWNSLMVQEVGLTDQQLRALLAQRQAIHAERVALANCEQLLRDLRQRIRAQMSSLNRQVDVLQSIMSPLQLAKFYVWVEQNEWCMQMLGAMWSAQPSP